MFLSCNCSVIIGEGYWPTQNTNQDNSYCNGTCRISFLFDSYHNLLFCYSVAPCGGRTSRTDVLVSVDKMLSFIPFIYDSKMSEVRGEVTFNIY